MLLSPYHNPAYRSPAPRTPTTSPPADPSPKRKRSESVSEPSEALRLQTNLQHELTDAVPGNDSPRSKVAEKFRDLELDHARREDPEGITRAPVKHKRLKTRAAVKLPSAVKDPVIAETPDQQRRTVDESVETVAEIQETPQVQRERSSSPSAPENALANFRNAFPITKRDAKRHISPKSTPLPPSPRVMISPPLRELQDPVPDRALSPLQLSEELSLDQAALTWQDSEITGHEIDALQGDDGLGINGIGFRPTPAMAQARSQKRKQQVIEWKAREAREARQRRMDRRRGAGSGSEGAAGRRAVRFEDVG